ncbi:MAG: hypothetical protein H7Z10_09600 [Gemmatimonadaceae bacterium]|nr:hypothetical protein [Acetobacteraceae bacterium]
MFAKWLLAGAFAAAAGVASPQAAVVTANLDVISKPEIGSGTLGVVTVTDISGGITVSVSLTTGFKFLQTGGKHVAFAVNLNAAPTSVTGISPAAYSVTPGRQEATPYGFFSLGLDCGSCGNGAPDSIFGPISFVANGVSTASLAPNAKGFTFAADLLNVANGNTGSVASRGGTFNATVPVAEPVSMAVLGSGLLALGMLRRKRA